MSKTATQSEIKFQSSVGFFMSIAGVTEPLNKEVLTGNLEQILVESLTCNVRVIEPDMYGITTNPVVRISWSYSYCSQLRNKQYSSRSKLREATTESVNNVLGEINRLRLEHKLVNELHKKLANGIVAISKLPFTTETENN